MTEAELNKRTQQIMFENIEQSIDEITKQMEQTTDNIIQLGYEIYKLHGLIELITHRIEQRLTQNLSRTSKAMITKMKNDFTNMQFELIDDFSIDMDFNIGKLKDETDKQTEEQPITKEKEMTNSKTQIEDSDSENSSL